MGERRVAQDALFYEVNLDRHVPADHLLRAIDRFVDLSGMREHLRGFDSEMRRPLIDPELMLRMLIVGYCCDMRLERRLCEEVHLNPAYRCSAVSIGVRSGPPIGAQKGPPLRCEDRLMLGAGFALLAA
jgi:Transposase domain (DUF772)